MPDLGLYILDVGHGNAAVLVDDRGVLLVDAARGNDLPEFVTREGIARIDFVLLSHADADHIRGLIGLLSLVRDGLLEIGEVRLNPDPRVKDSATWTSLLIELEQARRRGDIVFDTSLNSGHTGRFNIGETDVEVLAPSPLLAGHGVGWVDGEGRTVTANSLSAVVRLVRNGKPVAVLAGDIDEVGLDHLLDEHGPKVAPLAVYPHHGGRPGDTGDPAVFADRFSEAFSPDHVVFSIGRGGKSVFPRVDVIEAVRARLLTAHIACTQLSRHCCDDLPEEATHLTPHWSRGRDGTGPSRCCAGTVVVDLTDPVHVVPDAEHVAFVQAHVPRALCMRRTAGTNESEATGALP